MSYGLNVEMHKQVNFTTTPFLQRFFIVVSLNNIVSPREIDTQTVRCILFPSLFGDKPLPSIRSLRGPASVNVACLPESLKRDISLSHVHGRINICLRVMTPRRTANDMPFSIHFVDWSSREEGTFSMNRFVCISFCIIFFFYWMLGTKALRFLAFLYESKILIGGIGGKNTFCIY